MDIPDTNGDAREAVMISLFSLSHKVSSPTNTPDASIENRPINIMARTASNLPEVKQNGVSQNKDDLY